MGRLHETYGTTMLAAAYLGKITQLLIQADFQQLIRLAAIQ